MKQRFYRISELNKVKIYLSFFLSTFFKIILQFSNVFSAAIKNSSIDVPFCALFRATNDDLYSWPEF